LTWVAFDPIFREKVVEMERPHPRGNFHLGFETFHLQQLPPNWFFRENGKQPLTPLFEELAVSFSLMRFVNTRLHFLM